MRSRARTKKVYFAYGKALSFSGQSSATELIIRELSKQGWDCRSILIHPLDRSLPPWRRYPAFIAGLLKTWGRFAVLLIQPRPILYLNLGQSMASFVRVAPAYLPVRLLRPDMHVVISLHGSVFMQWRADAIEARIFRLFLRSASLVTVLGTHQRDKLVKSGIARHKIQIVPNTCDMPPVDADTIRAKHVNAESEPVRLLHLSLLLESKGFPEYLEALQLLAGRAEMPGKLHAVLCGPVAFSSYCSRFKDPESKENWIVRKIAAINETNGPVFVQWVRGAQGEEKQKLFAGTDIFVFPSQFPVEAQPLVLLEALASGCCIISTAVGEIPSTLNDSCYRRLESPDPQVVADQIHALAFDPVGRRDLALAGLSLYQARYSLGAYGRVWAEIFSLFTPDGKAVESHGGGQ